MKSLKFKANGKVKDEEKDLLAKLKNKKKTNKNEKPQSQTIAD